MTVFLSKKRTGVSPSLKETQPLPIKVISWCLVAVLIMARVIFCSRVGGRVDLLNDQNLLKKLPFYMDIISSYFKNQDPPTKMLGPTKVPAEAEYPPLGE